MFSFLSGLLSKADYGRWPMRGWDQSSEAAVAGRVWGYGHILPMGMGRGWPTILFGPGLQLCCSGSFGGLSFGLTTMALEKGKLEGLDGDVRVILRLA